MGKQVLVTGASGFVGSHLAEELETRGYSVRAMTRQPDTYSGAGKPVFGDVYDPASLRSALAEVDAAYYLVHSLARHDFVEKDAEAARSFGTAAADAGLERLIYLGGLGRDGADLSAHLRSRREVEHLLALLVRWREENALLLAPELLPWAMAPWASGRQRGSSGRQAGNNGVGFTRRPPF